MGLDIWTAHTEEGNIAEYRYSQSPANCWASRKTRDLLDKVSPVPGGLTREQVEKKLFGGTFFKLLDCTDFGR